MNISKRFLGNVISVINDSLGTSWQTGSNSNASIRVVTSEAQLNTSLSGTEKELSIQGNITLTGNITFANGAIITDGGGKITVGAFDLTFVNNSFKSDYIRTFIDLGQNGTINNASTFSNGDIVLNWFGLVGDGSIENNTGTDNRNVFLETQKIYNSTNGNCKIKGEATFMKSVETVNPSSTDAPTGWYITNGASLDLDDNVKIGAFGNALPDYAALTIWDAENTHVRGGQIFGDWLFHDYTNGNDEGCASIVVANESRYVEITTSPINGSGDAIYTRGAPNWDTDILVDAVFTKNFDLNSTTGTPEASTTYNYSDRFTLSRSTSMKYPQLNVNGGSWGGWRGMTFKTYRVAFYDNTAVIGNTTTGFMNITDEIQLFENYNIPSGAAYCRLIFPNPEVWGDVSATLAFPFIPQHITYAMPLIKHGVRMGFANPSPHSRITGVNFFDNGKRVDGTNGWAGMAFSPEDGYQRNRYVGIDNCIFQNTGTGFMTLKHCMYYTFDNNKFLRSNDSFWGTGTIDCSSGYYTKFTNNLIEADVFSGGREGFYQGNTYYNTAVRYAGENETWRNEVFNNCSMGADVEWAGDPSRYGLAVYNKMSTNFENCVWYFDKYQSWWNSQGHNFVKIKDCKVIYGTKEAPIEYAGGSLTYAGGNNAIAVGGTAEIDGLEIIGIVRLSEATMGDDTQALQLSVQKKINRLITPVGVNIKGAYVGSFALTNSRIESFLAFNISSDYPTTNTGDKTLYDIITIDNVDIPINDYQLVHDYSGMHGAIRTDASDVNLVMKNGTVEGAGDDIFELNHYGATTITNWEFKGSGSIDLTLDAIDTIVTFIDCDFDGYTVTLKAGDKILYTKSNPNLEVYVDNTAALAGGIPVGYMYRTATGQTFITY